jgi:CheY-like chemotaxis protein
LPAAHILVVDDVEKNTRFLADLLGAKGYRTSKANSGAQALELIEGTAPDLVLLDVMMPGMSGYEVCRTLRADPRHALLPVVMVTALDPAAERTNGLDAGADDFLNKPINQAELLARVRSLLRVKTLQDQLLRERAVRPVAAAPSVAPRCGDFTLLCVRWPAITNEPGAAEPDALLARHQSLQDRVVATVARHAGAVTDLHAHGLTALFDHALLQSAAPERGWALANDLAALGEGFSIGMAQGPATVGTMRRPDGCDEYVAIGVTVQRADQWCREALPNDVRADSELFASLPR